MNRFLLLSVLGLSMLTSFGQDATTIRALYNESLRHGQSYELLHDLTKNIGARLPGSPAAASAVGWGRDVMTSWEFDSVWLQPVMVPRWVRGQAEVARIRLSKKRDSINVNVCALGLSTGTGPDGVRAHVLEVKSLDELKLLSSREVKGKIVFFNGPMDPAILTPFKAYENAVPQRVDGASTAARLGATGVVVRSMNPTIDDYPHTGAMRYADDAPRIPAVAISTRDAELLSKLLKEDKDLSFYFETHCENFGMVQSYNVIGQIKGGEYADQIIVVGGHLDSWDLAEGAHDDGTGSVQAMEAVRLIKAIGYRPRRTIRAVLFMAEESGVWGGKEYGRIAQQKNEKHLAAIESDQGGFSPRGFAMQGDEKNLALISGWKNLFAPYGITDFMKEEAGADIDPLKDQGTFLLGLYPDPQSYFDYHHTSQDTFDKVSRRELELGAAAMASMIYLIDYNGLK